MHILVDSQSTTTIDTTTTVSTDTTTTTTTTPTTTTPTPVDKNVDLDGNGGLSLAEVQFAAFTHHGLSSNVVADMFRQVDTNGDHELNSIEFNAIRPLVLARAEDAAQRTLTVCVHVCVINPDRIYFSKSTPIVMVYSISPKLKHMHSASMVSAQRTSNVCSIWLRRTARNNSMRLHFQS